MSCKDVFVAEVTHKFGSNIICCGFEIVPSSREAIAQQSELHHGTSCFLLIVELLLFLVCTSLVPQDYYTIAIAASVVECCCCWPLFSSGSMRRLQKNETDQEHGIAVCKLQVTAAHTKKCLGYLGVS